MQHLLDEEVAERDPNEAALAVADGVEDGGIRLEVRIDLPEDEVLHGARESLAQGHLHEDEGLVGEGGVKEPEAAPVRLQAALKVLPVEDLVHRLVLDDLLQHERGSAPVDAPEVEEPAVEPRAEQVEEVRVERLELRVLRQDVEQRLAHREEVRHAVRRGVEEGEQLAARRRGGAREGSRGPRAGRRPVVVDSPFEAGRLRAELMGEEPEELAPAALLEPGEGIERGAREGHHRRLAAGPEEGPADLPDVVGPPGAAGSARRSRIPPRARATLAITSRQKRPANLTTERPPPGGAARSAGRSRPGARAGGPASARSSRARTAC